MKDENSVPAAQKITDVSLSIFRSKFKKTRIQMIDYMHWTQTRSTFLPTVLTGLLVANGCGGAAPIQVPPSLPDISGTYLLNFGTGPSGALAIASLTVTLNQTEWLNGINTLGSLPPLC